MSKLEKAFWIALGTALAVIALSIASVLAYAALHLIITGHHL